MADNYFSSLVQETPAVDVHSHQGVKGVWQARSLAEILSYHWLRFDLLAVGAPMEDYRVSTMDPREQVRRVAPYFKLVRNTVNYWCFANLARDLYGFRDEYVDEGNWEWLYAAVEAHVEDPNWERHVLDQAGVDQVSAPFHMPARVPERYFLYETGEYMFCPGLQGNTQQCLAKIGDGPITSAAGLAEAIDANVRFLVAAEKIRALHVWAPQSWTYTQVDEGRAETLLHRSLASTHMEQTEQDELVSFAAERVAEVCGELGIVVQLFCGVDRMEPGGPHVSYYRPEFLRALVPFFSRYAETQFDLFLGTRLLSHEAAVLARHYPNLWVSGGWWSAFTPSTLTEFFRDRLEMLPMTKWNAFFSDAYCVEWVYGKSTLTRNRLALALSDMVEEDLLNRSTAEEMARRVLYDNPRQLYLKIDSETCGE
ncbi:MAG TPA: hypothetical protein VGM19_02835 [Armatimonadota bacterium]|jgi:hypothetical protein